MINKSYLNTSTPCQLENEAETGPLLAYEIKVCMWNIFQRVICENTVRRMLFIHVVDCNEHTVCAVKQKQNVGGLK